MRWLQVTDQRGELLLYLETTVWMACLKTDHRLGSRNGTRVKQRTTKTVR